MRQTNWECSAGREPHMCISRCPYLGFLYLCLKLGKAFNCSVTTYMHCGPRRIVCFNMSYTEWWFKESLILKSRTLDKKEKVCKMMDAVWVCRHHECALDCNLNSPDSYFMSAFTAEPAVRWKNIKQVLSELQLFDCFWWYSCSN